MAKRRKAAAKEAVMKSAKKSSKSRAKRSASGHKRKSARGKRREMTLLDHFLSLFGPSETGKRNGR